jgi:PAS domain S-box-containing protein
MDTGRFKNYFKNILDSSQIAILVADNSGLVRLFNEGAVKLTGWTEDEALGKPIDRFYSKAEEPARIAELVEKYGKIEDYETTLRHKDGKEIPASLSISALKDSGFTFGTLAIALNMEDRQKARQELLKRNHDLGALLEAGTAMTSTLETRVVLGVIISKLVDLLKVDHGYVMLADERRRELYVGMQSEGFDVPVDNLRISFDETSICALSFREGRPLAVADARSDPRVSKRLVQAFGDRSILTIPLVVHGNVIGVIFLSEVSGPRTFTEDEIDLAMILAHQAAVALENARLYSQLKQNAQLLEKKVEERTIDLVRADKAKTEFLTNMSHEFRTPLNSIIGFSEILMNPPSALSKEESAEFLENIRTSGEHLLQLVNDILDIAKVESGKMELHLEDFSLSQLLEGIRRVIRPLAQKKRISLEMRQDEMLYLNGDSGKIKQIIFNLLSNAVKFTPESGKIELVVRLIEPNDPLPAPLQREFFPGRFLLVSVKDSGIGISREDRDHIFDVFYQVDGSTSRRFEGTGLGLTLTRQLVELHGGKIWLESEPGVGSTFTFVFPLSPVGDDDAKEARSGNFVTYEIGHRPRILVVEDDPNTAQLLSHYLAYGGFRIAYASSGADAIRKARQQRPLAMIIDVLMNREKALDILAQVKQNPATAAIPTVLLSMGEGGASGINIGTTDYLPKPIECQRLLDLLAGYDAGLEGGKRLRVLAIDDEEAVLAIIRGLLELEGYEIYTAADGNAGLDMARKIAPDLILLDLMMPGMDGFSVLTSLKNEPSLKSVPVIILTAKRLTKADHERFEGHIHTILSKTSFSKDELLKELHRLEARAAR